MMLSSGAELQTSEKVGRNLLNSSLWRIESGAYAETRKMAMTLIPAFSQARCPFLESRIATPPDPRWCGWSSWP
eukprot:11067935-Ditylum_brightwellii.AAC.1